ncbi:hypothetical protein JCM10213_007867 [Rhodosporidiobolus nylandii]
MLRQPSSRPGVHPVLPTLSRNVRFSRGKKGLPPWDEDLNRYRSNPSFRRPPSGPPLPPGTPVQAHPRFEYSHLIAQDVKHMWVTRSRRGQDYDDVPLRACRLPFAQDYATSPAVQRIRMELVLLDLARITGQPWDSLRTRTTEYNPGGVRVVDVLAASAKLWGSKPPREIAQIIAEMLNEHPCRKELDMRELKVEEITWQHVLLDHDGFNNWDEVEVVKSGVVKLGAP